MAPTATTARPATATTTERRYECKDDGQHGGIEYFFGARWVCKRHAIARGIY